MRLWHSLTRGARLILIANFALLIVLTIVSFNFILPNPKVPASGSSSASRLIQELMLPRSMAVLSLFDAQLEQVEKDAEFIAEVASHIFSHPQSFRLAAQPGEYDFDSASGLYGSLRNDGTSVLFLSAGTQLSPEILHDIRLSEYLNPIFRSVVLLKPHYAAISLYTTDSLLRSYPWFDVKQQLAAGLLKKDFKSSELTFFDNARPEKNPSKKSVWTLTLERGGKKPVQAVCSVPLDSNGAFKGIIAVEPSLSKVAARSFATIEPQGEILLFLKGENEIVDLGGNADSGSIAPIQRVLGRLPREAGSHFEQLDDFYVQSTSSRVLPLRLISVLRDVQAIKLGLALPVPVTSQSRPWIISAVAAVLLLVLLNLVWNLRAQHDLENSRQQLSQSFSALADLNLDSAFTRKAGDLFERFDDAVRSVKARLETLATQKDQEALKLISGNESAPGLSADEAKDLDIISTKIRVLNCFETAQPMDVCLSKLVKLLAETSQVQTVWFLFYSPSENCLRGSVAVHGVAVEVLKKVPIPLKAGGLFERVISSKQILWLNSIRETPTEYDLANQLISKSLLICPLVEHQNVFALLVLGDKSDDFSKQDEIRIAALQESITHVVKDAIGCEGLRKIDLLRRTYCAQLTRAIEGPLHRIRGEVQSIYSRLGRLTPYYKHHCETILFEIGRLYEIAREASEIGLETGESADNGARRHR